MRATMLVMLAACGGGGDTGSFDATVTMNGRASEFAESCKLTETETSFDIAANGDGIGFEIKWRKQVITTVPGTYHTDPVLDDLDLFVVKGEDTEFANGSVTFTTYTAPDEFVGYFNLTSAFFIAGGSFNCH